MRACEVSKRQRDRWRRAPLWLPASRCATATSSRCSRCAKSPGLTPICRMAHLPKSATLEGDTVSAQKLGLAGSIGTLSLLLRKAGEASAEKSLRITLKDLFSDTIGDLGHGSSTTVTVRRGGVKEGYSVPVENPGKRAVA